VCDVNKSEASCIKRRDASEIGIDDGSWTALKAKTI
jgi:hypothetical protein